jgi:hypothetical protein
MPLERVLILGPKSKRHSAVVIENTLIFTRPWILIAKLIPKTCSLNISKTEPPLPLKITIAIIRTGWRHSLLVNQTNLIPITKCGGSSLKRLCLEIVKGSLASKTRARYYGDSGVFSNR